MRPKPTGRGALVFLRNFLLIAVVFVIGMYVGNGKISLPGGGNSQNASQPAKLDYSSVDTLYKSLKANYDGKLSEQQLEDGLKHGLAESAHDPYTVYFTAKEAKDFNDELNNSFS